MARALLVLPLLLLVVLSGCVGDKGSGPKTAAPTIKGSGGPLPPTSSDPVDCALDGDLTDCASNDPKRHYHHYWGDLTQVDIFYARDMPLQQDAFKGINQGCKTIGHREFDLETDENDAGGKQDPPVSPVAQPNPRADVVFAGTVRIEVKLLQLDLDVPNDLARVYFMWKPANLNFFLPGGQSCGMELALDEVKSIAVGPGASDPPHQWLASRWKFMVWVATPQGDQGAPITNTGQGRFGIQMTAINGGENTLDPAHPDLWAGSNEYSLGCAKNDAVPRQLVITTNQANGALDRKPQWPLDEIKVEYGRIVPLVTQKVTGVLTYDYKGPVDGTVLKVLYYGGDSNLYAPPDEVTEEAGKVTFTIFDNDQLKADPPYLAESQWRFRLQPYRPAADAGGANVADFEGSFEICWTAHRFPDVPFT